MSAEQTLLAAVASVLTAAGSIAKITNGPRVLLAKLGWDLPPGVDDVGLVGMDIDRVGTQLVEWTTIIDDADKSTEDKAIATAELADAVITALSALSDLHFEAPQDYLDKT